MIKILIVYHSQSGNTERMAGAVAKGVESIENSLAIVKKAFDASLKDIIDCNGVAIGSPEYFGYMAGAIKDFFDRTYDSARGRREVFRKPYVVFISAGNDGRGALSSIQRICTGYQFKMIYEPVIARGKVDDEILARCEELGKVIAAGCEAGIY